MSRFDRKVFNLADLNNLGEEAKTRLQFDWLCDDTDRPQWLNSEPGRVTWILSRAHVEDDPAPPRSMPVPQGRVSVAMITDPTHVEMALKETGAFGNAPYTELGGGGFMLAIDPGVGFGGVDWHAEQRGVATAMLNYPAAALQQAAKLAIEQASVLSLRASGFDLAEFAEQAALRYLGLVFGFAGRDHILLEDAARTGYRALQYLIIGRHFVSEPGALPAAQQALARLATRSASLIDDYARLKRSPRLPLRPSINHPAKCWPDGVQPWDQLGLSALGDPILRRLPDLAGRLSGQDLCNLICGLVVGTVGNVQTALCLTMHRLLRKPADLPRLRTYGTAQWTDALPGLLAQDPPVPFLPRRTLKLVDIGGKDIPPGTDCILALRATNNAGCPHAWGEVQGSNPAHSCIGRGLIEPLLAALLQHTVGLPGLAERLDALTGEELKPRRLWGMGCSHYPLRHDREKLRVQQPLIVVMRVKSPIAEHAERLRRVIRSGAPRIQWALDDSRHVHMAWFEFMENDSLLALRTVYDGDFDSYIQHFALNVGDLFDDLFESIEGGPPRPVAENPNAFVETIRRFNRAPLGGFFYSAYPSTETSDIVR